MTIALLSHTYKQGNSGGSGTSPAIDTTGASLLVAYVADFTGSSPATFADSQGNTWTALTARPLTGNMRSQMYYCASPSTSASHTFSATGTNSFAAIAIAAYSGTATSPYDQETGATTLTGTSLATGSVTPSENNELVIYGCGYASSALSVSVGTMLDTAAIIGGMSYGIGLAYEIQTTATARSPSWSWSSSNSCSTTIATFKAAASGPTYTLTASGGSYTDTGGTAGLVAGRKIVASGGGYTHTGGTAALQAGRKLAASGGAFTETGGTAGLVVGRKLVADGGAYAFTGGDANLVYTPVGGATYTLSASGGMFALTGGDVAFLEARKLVVDGGQFALSGGGAAFTYPYVDATPAASLGRARPTARRRRLQEYDVPMPAEVLTSTIPQDTPPTGIKPVPTVSKLGPASKLARPAKVKAPAAPKVQPPTPVSTPEPQEAPAVATAPAAPAVAPVPAAVKPARALALADILSAQDLTHDELLQAVKLLARELQDGPTLRLVRSHRIALRR